LLRRGVCLSGRNFSGIRLLLKADIDCILLGRVGSYGCGVSGRNDCTGGGDDEGGNSAGLDDYAD
jgi:hypothetical protein